MKGQANKCIYCGIPVRGATCNAHRDLPRLDPMRHPALKSGASHVSEGRSTPSERPSI